MPLPNVVAPVTDAAVGRHVFVSYARADLQAAKLFMDKLYALAASDKRLRLSKERIFFDQDRLKAGDEFGPVIESQLLLADVFLLLVSDKSLTSPYCLNKELAIAVAQGARIVPVLLAAPPGPRRRAWGRHRQRAAARTP